MFAGRRCFTLGSLAIVFLTACSVLQGDETVEPTGPAKATEGNPNGAESGAECGAGSDCKSGVCEAGACAVPKPDDAVKNGDETDTDCGGTSAPCADGKACVTSKDCASQVCTGNVCQAPKADDGVKNGDESDVDCGGSVTGAPRCAVGKSCNAHGDCTTDG